MQSTVTYMVKLYISIIWFVADLPYIGNFGHGRKSLFGKEWERSLVSLCNLEKILLGCCETSLVFMLNVELDVNVP